MLDDISASEGVYRIVDGIYRLHRDMFELESVIARTARVQVQLTRIGHDGRMGALVAALLAIVPVMISLGKIEWGSAPAIFIYAIAGVVVLLWAYQIVSAGKVSRELVALEGSWQGDDLRDRLDFGLEEINAWVSRYKLALGIAAQLSRAEQQATDDQVRSELQARRERYEEIARSCEDYVGGIIAASQRLVRAKQRSKDAHKELLHWAAAIPKFSKAG
jgi:hypothetical protein